MEEIEKLKIQRKSLISNFSDRNTAMIPFDEWDEVFKVKSK